MSHSSSRKEESGGDGEPRRVRRYQHVLATISANTSPPSGPQRAGLRRPRVHLQLGAHGPYTYDELEKSISDALEDGDLVSWTDSEGVEYLAVASVSGLEAVVAQYNAEREPPVEVLEDVVLPALAEARNGS